MATLIILRGSTPDREIELGDGTLRIGRGDQNDVVLPDPAKSVSRFHAELRAEQGRFVVVDLNSQNGVWVAGRRVPHAMLEPDVPVVLGTYQLVLKAETPPRPDASDATVVGAMSAAGPPSATMVAPNPLLDGALPPLVRHPTEIAPIPVPLSTPPPKPAAPAPARTAPSTRPAAPAKATAPAKTGKPPLRSGGGLLKWVLIGGIALLALAAAIAAVMLTPVGSRPSEPAGATSANGPAAAPEAPPPAASTPVEAPVAPPVEPLPMASVPVTPPVTPPVTSPTTRPPAPPRVEPQPVAKPVAPPQRTPPAGRRGAATPAAEPKAKGPNLALAFEEARAAINRGDYPAAIAGLESILSVDPAYPKAVDMLGVARSSALQAAKTAVDAGGKAEADREYAEAERQYQRALLADPQSGPAQDGLRRVKARMLADGEDAFKRARQYDALGRVQEAVSMYEKAIQLLPSDHASVRVARERLAALKGAVEE